MKQLGKAARYRIRQSTTVSTDLLPRMERDLPLPKTPKVTILAPGRGSRGMSDESLYDHRCRCWTRPMRLLGSATRHARSGDYLSGAANTAGSPAVSFCSCAPSARGGVSVGATIGAEPHESGYYRSPSLSSELDRKRLGLWAMVKAKPPHPTVGGDGMAFAALGKRAG